MRSIRLCILFAASWLLCLPTPVSAAGKKIHIGAKLGEILNLETDFVPNDGSSGHGFNFDGNGPGFVVPDGFSFVVTDLNIVTFGSSDVYSLVVLADDVGNRSFPVRFVGVGYTHAFTTGFVIPPGATPSVVNNVASPGGVLVQLQGYLVKGAGLAPNEGL